MPEKLRSKKSLGQHFLNNRRIPARMADAAELKASEIVFEIGPGTGVLTKELLERGARVIAVEADERALTLLEESFAKEIADGSLVLKHGDMRTLLPKDLGLKEHKYKVVSNIPYYLSGKLFRTLLASKTQPSRIVFLVQKEVAQRIARDSKESLLSLSVKAFGNPTYIETVRRGNFNPPPAVDSAILCIADISHKPLRGIDENLFFKILHIGFSSKRKQLLSNLSHVYDRKKLTHIFSTLHLPLTVRAEDLGIDLWLTLVRKLKVHS